jgi:hypothetical protein
MFKLNSGSGNNSRSLSSSSSSSSNSNKLFKFKSNNGNSNGSSNGTFSSRVLKLDGNKNGNSQPLFKSNGNKNNTIFSNNSNNSNKKIGIFSNNGNKDGNKLFSGNKLFHKNDNHDHHISKLFSKHCHNGFCYPKHYHYCHSYPSYPCYGHLTSIPLVALAYEPLHSNYVVMPGDTLYTIAFNEYGTSLPAKHIAAFNGIGPGSSLIAGRILNLPSISPSGVLTPSGAPIADVLRTSPIDANAMRPAGPMVGGPVSPMAGRSGPLSGPAGPVAGPVGPMGPTASGSPVAPQNMSAPRPQIAVGSMLQVDGQTFGDKPGMARLLVGGVALKIDIVEWFGSAIKIRMPMLDLAGPSSGEIEILRADGSLAAKTPVELVSPTAMAQATR